MTKLFVAFIVLATLGSIYPFNFELEAAQNLSLSAFLATCCALSSRGDILGNIILFIPIGFTGVLAAVCSGSTLRQFLSICLIATAIATLLQVLQIYLPTRDANLQDVIWNLVGSAGGAAAALFVRPHLLSDSGKASDMLLVPVTLVGTWLIYRLIPFIPSLDLQSIKNSVRPIFDGGITWHTMMGDAVAWVVVAYLIRNSRPGAHWDRYLVLLVVAVFGLEILVIANSISLTNIFGAVLAIVVWHSRLSRYQHLHLILAALLMFMLVVRGVMPFELRTNMASFNWTPFYGFLSGSMYVNAQSAAEKVFLYGSFVYLLWVARVNIPVSVLIGFFVVLAIEFAQTIFIGHTPEITDPMLVLFAAFALLAIGGKESIATVAPVDAVSNSAGALAMRVRSDSSPVRNESRWVVERVNLRQSQADFLSALALAMDVSVSRVVRKIVVQFIDELDQKSSERKPAETVVAQTDESNEWVSQQVNLRRDQYSFLLQLSSEMDASVSRVIRRIVGRFIAGLDGKDPTPEWSNKPD